MMPTSPRRLGTLERLRELRVERPRERPSAKAWGVVVFGLLLATGIHSALSARSLAKQKSALLARHRAVKVTFGPRWALARTAVTDSAVAAAREPWAGDYVDPSLRGRKWRSEPAVFFRLGSLEAGSPEAALEAAKLSPRDAFLSCLRGPQLRVGEDGLARFHRLQEAFAVTRLLDDAWVDNVQSAGNDLRVRVFENQFAGATQEALQAAVVLVESAKLVLVVVDEMGAPNDTDGRAIEDIQRGPHGMRIMLSDRATRVQLARIRVEPSPRRMLAGEGHQPDDDTLAAVERQSMSCAAARLFDAAIDAAISPQ